MGGQDIDEDENKENEPEVGQHILDRNELQNWMNQETLTKCDNHNPCDTTIDKSTSNLSESSAFHGDDERITRRLWRRILKLFILYDYDLSTIKRKLTKDFHLSHFIRSEAGNVQNQNQAPCRPLTSREEFYLSQKMLKYASDLWKAELPSKLDQQSSFTNRPSVNIDELNKVLEQLEKTSTLSQIPDYTHTLKFQLVLLIFQNEINSHRQLQLTFEQNLVSHYKKIHAKFILNSCAELLKELEFFTHFHKFLTSQSRFSIKKQIVGPSCNLNADLPKQNFIVYNIMKNIDYVEDKNWTVEICNVFQACREIQDQEPSSTFKEKYQSLVSEYFKPTKYEKNGHILKITGSSISFDRDVEQPDCWLNNVDNLDLLQIKEVHIISSVEILVDADLTVEFWRGKNLFLYTKQVFVHQVTIDLSGKPANPAGIPPEKPATPSTPGECGLNGVDGEPGESGGNFLIITDKIHNKKNLLIISNGGAGSNGGKGGDGAKGADGQNGGGDNPMTMDKFKRIFTSPIIDGWTTRALDPILNMASSGGGRIEERVEGQEPRNYYYQISTPTGAKVFYSTSQWSFNISSYARYQGARGAVGGKGGLGGWEGRGGMGGYPGEIHLCTSSHPSEKLENVSCCPGQKGDDGERGADGGNGKAGKNENDFGFLFPHQRYKTFYYEHPALSLRLRKPESTLERPLEFLAKPWKFIFTFGDGSMPLDDSAYCFYLDKNVDFIYSSEERPLIKMQGRQKERKKQNPLREASRKTPLQKSSLQSTYQEYLSQAKLNSEEQELLQQIGKVEELREKIENLIRDEEEHLANITITATAAISTQEHRKVNLGSQTNRRSKRLKDKVGELLEETIPLDDCPNDQENECPTTLIQLRRLIYQNLHQFAESLDNSSNDSISYKTKTVYIRDQEKQKSCLWSILFENDDDPEFDVSKVQSQMLEKCKVLIKSLGSEDNNKHQKLLMFQNAYKHALLSCGWTEIPEDFQEFLEIEDEKLLSKSKILEQYVEFLVSQYPTPADLPIISVVFDLNINLFVPSFHGDWPHFAVSSIVNENGKTVDLLYEPGEKEGQGQFTKLSKFFRRDHHKETVGLYSGILRKIQLILPKHTDSNNQLDDENFISKAKEEIDQMFQDVNNGDFNFRIEKSDNNQEDCQEEILEENKDLTESLKELIDQIVESCLESSTFDPNKLTQYLFVIGNPVVLNSLLCRWQVEGIKVTELFFLHVTSYLTSMAELDETSCFEAHSLVNWVLNAYPQNRWMDELALIQLEQIRLRNPVTFDPDKIKEWRLDMEKIRQKDVLSHFLGKLEVEMEEEQMDGENEDGQEINQEDGIFKNFDPKSPDQKIGTLLKMLREIQVFSRENLADLSDLALIYWPEYLKTVKLLLDFTQIFKVKGQGEESSKSLKTATYYVLSLHNEFQSFVVEFVKSLKTLKLTHDNHHGGDLNRNSIFFSMDSILNQVVEFLNQIYYGKITPNPQLLYKIKGIKTFDEFQNFVESALSNLSENNRTSQNELSLETIVEIIRGDRNSNLDQQAIRRARDVVKNVNDRIFDVDLNSTPSNPRFRQRLETTIRNYGESFRIGQPSNNGKFSIEQCIEKIDSAIFLLFGFRLRNTQKLTVALMVENNPSKNQSNLLAQVSTGEGKSFIVAASCIVKCLQGENCNVITSSPILAERDAKEMKELFNLFGITVGHNSSMDVEERKEAYKKQVVYGDAGNFQRDFLLTKYYDKNILGDRSDLSRTNVIIDEVDCLLLDNGNNVLYLSHQPGGLDSLESVFLHIWQVLVYKMGDGLLPDAREVKQSVIENIYPSLDRKMLKEALPKNYHQAFEELKKIGIVESNGRIKVSLEDAKKVLARSSVLDKSLQSHILYLVHKVFEQDRSISIPNCLKPFVELHLDAWIDSGVRALCMTENKEYVVDQMDKSFRSPDPHLKIIIVDRDTGVDQAQSQWSDGLHQFLQLKHSCKLEPLSLKAIFISNITYFQKYRQLLGLTGTLGSKIEREFLKNTYSTNYITIPPALPKQFFEERPLICPYGDPAQWRTKIISKTQGLIFEDRRSVLVICESVQIVDFIYEGYQKYPELSKSLKVYKRSYEDFSIENGELNGGTIILATNLAGRGTDIKVSDQLNSVGGLFVLLTYLPDNIRVEQQAFGRTSRKGQRGSGQLIIMDVGYSENVEERQFQIIKLKKERDRAEKRRICEIKNYFDKTVKKEEQFFQKFSNVYLNLSSSDSLKNIGSAEEREIILTSCLDNWSFILDEISSKFIPLEKHEEASILLHNFLKTVPRMKVSYPNHLMNRGKINIKDKNLDLAACCFDQIIKNEPMFCAGALYYKSLVILKKYEQTHDLGPFFKCLDLAKDQFKQLINQHMINITKVEQINTILSQAMTASRGRHFGADGETERGLHTPLTQSDSFANQQRSFIHLYNFFLNSIQEICGKDVNPENLVSSSITLEMQPYLLTFLQEIGACTPIQKTSRASNEKLSKISNQYGVTIHQLNNALNSIDYRKPYVPLDLPSKENFLELLVESNGASQPIAYLIKSPNECDEKIKIIEELMASKIISNQVESVNINNFVVVEGHVGYNHVHSTRFSNGFSETVRIFVQLYKILEPDHEIPKEVQSLKIVLSGHYPNFQEKPLSKHYLVRKAAFQFQHIDDDEELSKFQENIFSFLISRQIISHLGLLTPNFNKICSDPATWKSDPDLQMYKEDIYAMLVRHAVYRVTQLKLREDQEKNMAALEKSSSDLEDSFTPLQISIASHPEKNLFYNLINEDIIEMPKVTKSQDDIVNLLTHGRCKHISNANIDSFFKSYEQTNLNSKCRDIKELIRKSNGRYFDVLEDLEKSADSKKLWCKNLMEYIKMRMAFGRYHDNESASARHDIAMELAKLISPLKTVETPDGSLKNIEELLDDQGKVENLKEILTFSLNGLDSIFTIEEKRWSTKMLWQATFCLIAGIVQFGIGIVLELYSVGFGTHVAAAFISEGLGDITYALQSFYTGHFSAKDYWSYKWKSVAMSITGAAIGAYLSRAAKVSKFGREIVGKTGKLSDAAGKKLINEVGLKRLTPIIGRRVGRELLNTVVIGTTTFLVNQAVDKLLKDFCNQAAENAKSGVSEQIKKLDIQHDLQQLYQRKGEQDARIIVGQLFQKMAISKMESALSTAFSGFFGAVQAGILASGAKKSITTGKSSNITKMVAVLNQVLSVTSFLRNLQDVFEETEKFCQDFSLQLKTAVRNLSESNVSQFSQENFNEFSKWVKSDLENRIQENVSNTIQHKFVAPLMQFVAHKLVSKVGSYIEKKWSERCNNQVRERFGKAKQNYEESLRTEAGRLDSESKLEFQKRKRQEFDAELIKCMKMCTDPILYADIVRTGPPMSLVEIQAAANILGLRVRVTGVDGTNFPEEFQPDHGQVQDEITIDLKNGHFTSEFSQNNDDNVNTTSSDQSQNSEVFIDNNCFIRSLPSQYQNVDPALIRGQIADEISTNRGIHEVIANRWHKFYFDKKSFGGCPYNDKIFDSDGNQIGSVKITSEVKKIITDDNARSYVGKGGKYLDCTTFSKKGIIEADHIPPKNLYKYAKDEDVRKIHKNHMAAITLLYQDHRDFITTGNSNNEHVRQMRELFKQGKYLEAIDYNMQLYTTNPKRTGFAQSNIFSRNWHQMASGLKEVLRVHRENGLIDHYGETHLIHKHGLDQIYPHKNHDFQIKMEQSLKKMKELTIKTKSEQMVQKTIAQTMKNTVNHTAQKKLEQAVKKMAEKVTKKP